MSCCCRWISPERSSISFAVTGVRVAISMSGADSVTTWLTAADSAWFSVCSTTDSAVSLFVATWLTECGNPSRVSRRRTTTLSCALADVGRTGPGTTAASASSVLARSLGRPQFVNCSASTGRSSSVASITTGASALIVNPAVCSALVSPSSTACFGDRCRMTRPLSPSASTSRPSGLTSPLYLRPSVTTTETGNCLPLIELSAGDG